MIAALHSSTISKLLSRRAPLRTAVIVHPCLCLEPYHLTTRKTRRDCDGNPDPTSPQRLLIEQQKQIQAATDALELKQRDLMSKQVILQPTSPKFSKYLAFEYEKLGAGFKSIIMSQTLGPRLQISDPQTLHFRRLMLNGQQIELEAAIEIERNGGGDEALKRVLASMQSPSR
jgi:hypothetical protein